VARHAAPLACAAIALTAGSATFELYWQLRLAPAGVIVVLDAAGLVVFVVAGTERVLDFSITPPAAVLLIPSPTSQLELHAIFYWRRYRRCCGLLCMPQRPLRGSLFWWGTGFCMVPRAPLR
jgi:hypothetical protein